jgi:hypothetical protein
MGKSRKKKASASLTPVIIFPLLAVNAYCLWQLNKVANMLDIPLIGSWFDSITQISTIIMINSAVIILLAIIKNN